jgi:hypothetical protein
MSLKAGNYKGFAYATGEKIVSIESSVTTLKSDVIDASGVVVAFKEEFQDLSGQVQVLDASMAAVEVSVEDLSGVVVAFKEEFQDLSAQVQVLDASMAAVEVSVQDLSAEFQDLSGQVNAGGGGVGDVITATPISRNIENLNEDVVVDGLDRNPWSLTLSAGTYMFVFTPRVWLMNIGGDEPIWTSENCNCSFITFTLGTRELRFSVYPDLSVPVGNVGSYVKYFGKYTMVFTLTETETMGLTTRMSAPEIGVIALDPYQGYIVSEIEYVKLA